MDEVLAQFFVTKINQNVLVCIVASEILLYNRCLLVFVSFHYINDIACISGPQPTFLYTSSRHDAFFKIVAILTYAYQLLDMRLNTDSCFMLTYVLISSF